jgi:hypothetical protein
VPKICICLLCCAITLLSAAQKNFGIDQDYYIYQKHSSSIVPLVYYQTESNWYASFRYNYEEDQTASLQFGKTFSQEGKLSYSITPLAGWLAGKFSGIAIGSMVEIERGKFSFYTEPEYCREFRNKGENFFYNWAELSIHPHRLFYTGLALQTTRTKESFTSEPGLVFAFNLKNFEIPLYLFRSPEHAAYFVVGVHWAVGK